MKTQTVDVSEESNKIVFTFKKILRESFLSALLQFLILLKQLSVFDNRIFLFCKTKWRKDRNMQLNVNEFISLSFWYLLKQIAAFKIQIQIMKFKSHTKRL